MRDLLLQMQQTPVLPNSLAIWGLGQMGVAIKGPEGVIYIDACLSDVVEIRAGARWRRAYPSPLEPSAVTNASFYLISHEHLDHLDPMTAGPVARASAQARFIAPGWCRPLLAELDIPDERIIIPPALEAIPLPDSTIRVTAIPSAHYAKEYDADKGYRWLGYLIEWNGVTFYHAGDTIIYPGYLDTLRHLPTPDIAMLPVNGRDYYRESVLGAIGNLLPAEAAHLAHDHGWDLLIIGHNDLFANNAIPYGEIATALEQIAPRQKYKVLQPGELCYYVK
jgi:L-ascorbate metabolism protein UlaG (beta-lactamase superfamily)